MASKSTPAQPVVIKRQPRPKSGATPVTCQFCTAGIKNHKH